ncbi:MAG: IS21 family transposase [Desulfomonile sp.]
MTSLYDLYKSYKRVAREMGVSKNTVKKYIRRVQDVQEGRSDGILPKNLKTQPTHVLTSEVRTQIQTYLESNEKKPPKQRLTAKKIHELLVRAGIKIGYTSVKEEVADWKETHSPRKVFILQEHPEGDRAEFDWGKVILSIGGISAVYPIATMVLTYSLYRFSRIYPKETQQAVIQSHLDFFKEINAVPLTIFYDRLTAVYESRKKKFNERFLEFSTHSGFTPAVCNAASPHEKGTDEQSVGYVRKYAFSEKNAFASLEEANLWLSQCCTELNNGPVYRRDVVPQEGLNLERSMMKPRPSLEYSNYELKRCRISAYSMIMFEKNYYSVPDTYNPSTITLKVTVDTIEMLDGDTIIATHRRLTGQKQSSIKIEHYVKTLKRKPGAIRNSKVMRQVDEPIQNLFDQSYADNPKEFFPILDLLKETSEEALSYAIQLLEERNIPLTIDTLRFFVHQQSYQIVEPLNLFPEIHVDEPDLQVYDQWMER